MKNELVEELRAIRTRVGYSKFDDAVRTLNRERLEAPREQKRKAFPWSLYGKLYARQSGICPWCDTPMVLLRSQKHKVEVDHINPNLADFNAASNLQLLHMECNRKKSAKSLLEQSKETGKTVGELLGGGK